MVGIWSACVCGGVPLSGRTKDTAVVSSLGDPEAGDKNGVHSPLRLWVRWLELLRLRVWGETRPRPGPGAWGPAPVLVRRPRSVARRSLLGGSSSAALCLLLPPAPTSAAENRTFTWLPPAPPSGPASPVLLSHLSSCLLSPPFPPAPMPPPQPADAAPPLPSPPAPRRHLIPFQFTSSSPGCPTQYWLLW